MRRVSAAPRARRFGYQPALDGLRAVALLGIVAYHAGIESVPGGFLGVSAFFTLSGFLITTLLLEERVREGSLDLVAFWKRRLRRLLPALVAVVAAVAVTAGWWASDGQVDRLLSDVLASLFYVANWHFLVEGDAYGALFQDPSLLRHIWSLAVEEQFYLLFPPVLALATAGRRGPQRAVWILGLALLGALGLSWVLSDAVTNPDRLYFGTDTRFAELLVGAWLAAARQRWPNRLEIMARAPFVRHLSVVAIAGMAWMWATADPTDLYLYRGGLVLHALATAVVILAMVDGHGVIRRCLSWDPLVYLGLISYGAYLIHWPLIVWLEQNYALDVLPRALLVLGMTVLAASALYFFVEQPIRTAQPRRVAWLPLAAMAAVLVTGVVSRGQPAPASTDFESAQAELARLVDEAGQAASDPSALSGLIGSSSGPDLTRDSRSLSATPPSASDPTVPRISVPIPASSLSVDSGPDDDSTEGWPTTTRPDPPTTASSSTVSAVPTTPSVPPAPTTTIPLLPRMAVFGDSTSLMSGLGLIDWISGRSDIHMVPGKSELGCGLLEVHARVIEGNVVPERDCVDVADTWPAQAAASGANIAVVQLGSWEVVDQQLDAGGPFLSITEDPVFDELVLAELNRMVDGLLTVVDQVQFVTNPNVGDSRIESNGMHPEYAAARMERFRTLQRAIADARSQVVIVDLATWLHSHPDDLRLRPDGVHFGRETAAEVASSYLGPGIVDAWKSRTV